jgi:hypothetical protein
MTPFLALLCLAAPQQRLPEHIHSSDFKLAIKVTIDGDLVRFPDTQPMMVASHILVPMRGVFERMGAGLAWDQAMQTVTAERGKHHVVITMGKNMAEVDGAAVPLDQPAITVRGRTMVPLRFLGQSLGVVVDWLPADRTVALTARGKGNGQGSVNRNTAP